MLPKSLSAPQTSYTVLTFSPAAGSSNCLFRALSWALKGVEDHHIDLRRTIVEFEAAIFEAANNAINSTKTWPAIPFADYIRNMKKVCVGGTNLEIIAEASLFQIEIYLATETYNIGDPGGYSTLQNQCLSCLTGTSKNILPTSLSPPTH